MVSFLSFRKLSAALDRQLPSILPPKHETKATTEQSARGLYPYFPVESRRPREREDPCSFRTRLLDPGSEIVFDSTEKLDSEDLKFDDTQCISVNRSLGKFQAAHGVAALRSCGCEQDSGGRMATGLGPHSYSVPAPMPDPKEEERLGSARSYSKNDGSVICTPVEEHQDTESISKITSDPTPVLQAHPQDEGESEMETMSMPFWYLPKRQKRRSHRGGDSTIPDDMSIISNTSLIPTYCPSNVMKQQRPRHRALVKRFIVAKTRAARQTVRQLKRSCCNAVGHVFVEPVTHRPTECVPVGSLG
ncbi:hypothetical protein VTK56DRAFT_6544 [Thermocarpiscus australiensis]